MAWSKFFSKALKWIEEKKGMRAPEMPGQVRSWLSQVNDIKMNWESEFEDYIAIETITKEQAKEQVDAFADQCTWWIIHKFGAWLKPPLCLGELLHPPADEDVAQVAARICKNQPETPTGVDDAVWEVSDALPPISTNEYVCRCDTTGVESGTSIEQARSMTQ
jgi:hypothetical protein